MSTMGLTVSCRLLRIIHEGPLVMMTDRISRLQARQESIVKVLMAIWSAANRSRMTIVVTGTGEFVGCRPSVRRQAVVAFDNVLNMVSSKVWNVVGDIPCVDNPEDAFHDGYDALVHRTTVSGEMTEENSETRGATVSMPATTCTK